ncbi:hypothetical protein [Lysobacter capsici]|uniref:hypothetical protein n=1 Tax=Lysobacter capsici TaxID=435897 RepID=UPI001C000B3B|nr:hypothetical protein [Lysobacter capsici]QWF16903.1 hypothetical protein KME82_24755 [Lysobacter capsici]
MEAWQSVLLAIGGNTVLLAVLGWLGQQYVQGTLSRELERHKAELARESQLATERLRHDLQLVASERQITFSKLQERRATVIGDAYGLLVEAYWRGTEFASRSDAGGEIEMKIKFGAAINALGAFNGFFDKNRIYLPEAVCSALDSVIDEMGDHVSRAGGFIKYEESKLPQAALEKKFEAWDAAWKYFREKAPQAKLELERELRTLIGDKPVSEGEK